MKKATSLFVAAALGVFLAGCNRQGSNTEQAEQNAQKAEQNAQKAEQQSEEAQQKARRAERRASEARANRPRTDEAEPAGRRAVSGPEIPAGAVLRVRIDQPLDTSKNKPGDTFAATLEQPVVVAGRTVLPQGTRLQGSVTTAESSGRLTGNATLTVKLDSFERNGKSYRIDSTTVSRISGGHTKRDVGIIGGAGAAGAAIGGIVGGGRGAAIGAGAGAAAGTAGAAATGKLEVRIPAETAMIFTLQRAVRM